MEQIKVESKEVLLSELAHYQRILSYSWYRRLKKMILLKKGMLEQLNDPSEIERIQKFPLYQQILSYYLWGRAKKLVDLGEEKIDSNSNELFILLSNQTKIPLFSLKEQAMHEITLYFTQETDQAKWEEIQRLEKEIQIYIRKCQQLQKRNQYYSCSVGSVSQEMENYGEQINKRNQRIQEIQSHIGHQNPETIEEVTLSQDYYQRFLKEYGLCDQQCNQPVEKIPGVIIKRKIKNIY